MDYKSSVEKHDVISFDIFDTLLLRPFVNASDLFRYIETVYNVKDFSKIRVAAEKQARKKYKNTPIEDITIDEIYSCMPKDLLYLMDIEIDLEINQTMPNPEILEVFSYAKKLNKKVIIVSDMYFPKSIIERFLSKNGIEGYDNLFVSADYKKLKRYGSLFKTVIEELNVDPRKILHIGDNEVGDYQQPLKNNMDAILYKRVFDRFLTEFPGIKYLLKKYKNNLLLSSILMLSAIHYNKTKSYWELFGYLYAGLSTLSYVYWIKNSIDKKGIKEILFVARDGYLLNKIFSILYKGYKTHYVYAPRSICLSCTLNIDFQGKFKRDHAMSIVEIYNRNNENKIAVEDVLDRSSELTKLQEREVSNYEKYLSFCDIQNDRLAVVDSVSQFFSALKLFSKVLKNRSISGYYYQIQKKAKINDLDVSSFKPIKKYSKDLKLIEFIMSSPEPPILTLIDNSPKYKEISQSEEQRSLIFKDIETGCIACASQMNYIFSNSLQKYFTNEFVTDVLINLAYNPSEKDKAEFKKVKFAYDTQHANYLPLFPKWYKESFSSRLLKLIKNK